MYGEKTRECSVEGKLFVNLSISFTEVSTSSLPRALHEGRRDQNTNTLHNNYQALKSLNSPGSKSNSSFMVNLPVRLLFFTSSSSQVHSPTLRVKSIVVKEFVRVWSFEEMGSISNGSLTLSTCSFLFECLITSSNKWNHFLVKRKTTSVYCQSGVNAIKSGGFTSVLMCNGKAIKHFSVIDIGEHRSWSFCNGYRKLRASQGSTPSIVDIQEAIGIVKFIRRKKFLIIGATGFIGKVLIEKILQTVPDAGKIFLLIRAKNKEATMVRSMGEIINSELFKCLQQAHGRSYQALMLSKLVPVVGNICDSNLGLDEDLANVPRKEVEVITILQSRLANYGSKGHNPSKISWHFTKEWYGTLHSSASLLYESVYRMQEFVFQIPSLA
ncbi:Fatty acyl-coenzyme A reductase, NAD-binding domain [Dillenia turbinata]|uniref:Fatty acyl-CoA reductase n=1 Tax=Dillenia turbinata TaxID=194707 RepID=A0AAN8ZUG9_9MAGN